MTFVKVASGTEYWLLNQTAGTTAPASVTTPGDDLTLTNAGWGSDANGRYYQPATIADYGYNDNAPVEHVSANSDFSIGICSNDDGATPLNFASFCYGGDNAGASPNTSFYIAKRSNGFYSCVVNGPSGTSQINPSSLAIRSGLIRLLLTWSITTGTMTLYADGVQIGQVVTGFNNYQFEAVTLGNYNEGQGGIFGTAFPHYFLNVFPTCYTPNQAKNDWGIINGGSDPVQSSNSGVASNGLSIGLAYTLSGLASALVPAGANNLTGYIVNVNGTDFACDGTATGGTVSVATPQIFNGDVVSIRYPSGNITDDYFFSANTFTSLALVNHSTVVPITSTPTYNQLGYTYNNTNTLYNAGTIVFNGAFTTVSMTSTVGLPTPFRETLSVRAPSGQGNKPRRYSTRR